MAQVMILTASEMQNFDFQLHFSNVKTALQRQFVNIYCSAQWRSNT